MAGGLNVHPSEETQLDYRKAGGDWRNIPGVAAYRETGGEAPTREVVAFESTTTLTGRKRVPTIECEISAYSPHHTSYKDLRASSIDQTLLQFRLRTLPVTIFPLTTGVQIAIAAATGLVTLSGPEASRPDFKDDEFAPGLVIVNAGKLYVIDKIDFTTGAVTINPLPDSDVSAADFSVIRPALTRGPFAAKVAMTDRGQMSSESNLTTSIRLQPTAELPDWDISNTRA